MAGQAMAILFWFGVVFTIVAPVLLGVLGYEGVAWIALVAGAFVTLVSKLRDIAEITLGPVKAKMRETIAEAHVTIEQLRSVALASAKSITTSLISESFMGQHPFLERLRLKEGVLENLEMLGATENELRDAEDKWRRGITIIYERKIRRSFDGEPPEIHGPIYEGLNKLMDLSQWHVAAPAEYRVLLDRHGVLNEERKGWIDDYEHFLNTGEIRRLELWEEE